MTELVTRFHALAEVAPSPTGVIEGRAVPYGLVERVADPEPYREYDEVWEPGAFSLQIRHKANVGRVKLTYNHEPGWANWIGRTLELRETSDGLYGVWQLELAGGDLERMVQRIADGRLPGLSIGALAEESATQGGVVHRVRARLRHVSICEEPAFSSALVAAVRSKQTRNRASETLAALRAKRDAALGIERQGEATPPVSS